MMEGAREARVSGKVEVNMRRWCQQSGWKVEDDDGGRNKVEGWDWVGKEGSLYGEWMEMVTVVVVVTRRQACVRWWWWW